MKKDIKNTVLDKAIAHVAPRMAVKRFAARQTLAMLEGFAGASKTKRSLFGLSNGSQDADSWLYGERQTLIDRSHELTRSDPIASGVINANCTNIVGAGLKFHSAINSSYLGMDDEQAEAVETQIEQEFNLWAESVECDYNRQLNFYDLQELALRQMFVCGETIALTPYLQRGKIPYGLKIQIVEPERLCNPNSGVNGKQGSGNYLYDGVEKDQSGTPIKYHICSDFPNNYHKGNDLKWQDVTAWGAKTGLRNIIHVYKMMRPGQTRGIPYLAGIIDSLHNLTKYSKAVLDGAIVQTLFTVFLKTEGDTENILNTANIQDETGGKASDKDLKLAPGAIYSLKPGESIETASPGMPASNFDPFTLSIFRQIGIALEIPYEVLIRHFSSSYSASRAAILEAWRFYKTRRVWFARSWCQIIFESFMYEAVASGRIAAPGYFENPLIQQSYLGAEWVGPSQGHINPVDEANAIQLRRDMGLTTMTQETSEYNGGDFEHNIKRIKSERETMKDAGILQDIKSVAPPPGMTGNKIDLTMGG